MARGAVGHQLQRGEQADGAHVAHAGMARGQLVQAVLHPHAQIVAALHQLLTLVHSNGGHARGAAQGVTGVGQAGGQGMVVEKAGAALVEHHPAQRQMRRGEALGDQHHVGRGVGPMLPAEPLAGAAKAGHHLVGHQQNAIAGANLTYLAPVIARPGK